MFFGVLECACRRVFDRLRLSLPVYGMGGGWQCRGNLKGRQM